MSFKFLLFKIFLTVLMTGLFYIFGIREGVDLIFLTSVVFVSLNLVDFFGLDF
jgi:hypothetical protein